MKQPCPHCQKTKQRSEAELQSLIHRLNRIEGQIRGIRKMLESSAYCPDILVQSGAASAALAAFNKELLASHIRSCVVQDIRDGNLQCQRTAVNKGEVQVLQAGFAFQLLLNRDVSRLGHFFRRLILQLPEFPDSAGNLLNFEIQFLFHLVTSVF
jgi:DNA-binding FrmR family transcriptional regulator